MRNVDGNFRICINLNILTSQKQLKFYSHKVFALENTNTYAHKEKNLKKKTSKHQQLLTPGKGILSDFVLSFLCFSVFFKFSTTGIFSLIR